MKKTLLFLIFFFILVFSAEKIEAGSSDNVWGWAWSENISWISFNSINCDTNGNGQIDVGDSAPAGCPPIGTVIPNYGITVNPNGIFSGYAWSENIGWISFNRADTGVPPNPPFNGAETFIARVDDIDPVICDADSNNFVDTVCGGNNTTTAVADYKQVFGWARVLAYGDGWDGWIKLGKDPADGGPNYAVTLDTTPLPKEFRGWAWGSDVVGWVSFNCSNQGCGDSNYKVITSFILNNPPSANDLSVNSPNYCSTSPSYTFSWTYNSTSSLNESRFTLEIDNNSDFLTQEVIRDYSGLSNSPGTVNTQAIDVVDPSPPPSPPSSDQLAYNSSTYYWRVQVWDSNNIGSGWTTLIPATFTTASHRYPDATFTYSPSNPKAGQPVTFTADPDPTANPDRYSPYTWAWDFDGDGTPDSNSASPQTYTYPAAGNYNASLTITDSAPTNFSCTSSRNIGVGVRGRWREVIPR